MKVAKQPVTRSDVSMAKRHVKETVKLEKKKAKEHIKAAKKATDPKSRQYHLAHAKGHLADIKDRQKYVKKINKIRTKK